MAHDACGFGDADDLDQAHAAIAGDRQPLVEAEARNFRARGLAGLEQRVLRRDVDLFAVDDDLGHAACSLLRRRECAVFHNACAPAKLLPAERMLAWAMRDQMIEPRNAFRHVGPMSGGNPPQDQRGLDRREPFLAPGKETPVQCLPDKAFQRLDIFPHRQIRQDGRVIVDPHVHRVAAFVLQPPHEALDLVGKPVHAFDILDELAHARIVERIADPRDIELGEVAGLPSCCRLARRAARRLPELRRWTLCQSKA